ncbi:MAG: hypothetical protein HT580_17260 [Dechloromonas sp.]|nr:MAG: hypothetical protein HT580_17260 [Dechloromonas sp.]
MGQVIGHSTSQLGEDLELDPAPGIAVLGEPGNACYQFVAAIQCGGDGPFSARGT